MPTVQRWRGLAATGLTLLALGLVLVVLTAPDRLDEMSPERVRAAPGRAGRPRRAAPRASRPRPARARPRRGDGGRAARRCSRSFKLLDLGFGQALNRPFDPMIDWRYAERPRRDRPRLRPGSARRGPAGGRRARAARRPPRRAARAAPGLPVRGPAPTGRRCASSRCSCRCGWCSACSAPAPGTVPVASDAAASYAYAQVTRIPSELRDQREFARAAADDPLRDAPAADLLTGLRGKDVLFVFVESYGRVAPCRTRRSPRRRRPCSTTAPAASGATASRARSAFLTSPTFGAISWLAHSTLQSGLWVDSQQRYDVLVTSRRLHPVQRCSAGPAGARSPTSRPTPATGRRVRSTATTTSTTRATSATAGRGSATRRCPTSTPSTRSTGSSSRRATGEPVMAEIDLITSHAPWSRTPRPDRPGVRRRRLGLRRDARARCPPRPTSGPTPGAGARGVRPVDRVLPAGARLLRLDTTATTTGAWCCSATTSRRPSSPAARTPTTTCRSRWSPRTRPSSTPIAGWGWEPGMRPVARRAGLADGHLPRPLPPAFGP